MNGSFATAIALAFHATMAGAEQIRIDMIERRVTPPPILSNMIAPPGDLGVAGARLALSEIAATGKFTGQEYVLHETVVPPGAPFLPAVEEVLDDGARLLVVKASAKELLQLADLPAAGDALIFNATAQDDRLRGGDCRANLLHTTPSLSMRADALSQFALKKQWTDLVLIKGPNPEDEAFAAALRASLEKFGMALKGEKAWAFDANMRRVASAEIPLFTQDLPEHDLLLVADERGDYGRYVAYNTWVPRPLAGSEGIVPQGWSGVVEQWGAAQLQGRFRDAAGREMRSEDFGAWAAVAAIGEAVTRSGARDVEGLRDYLLSDAFRLAGYLGTPLSFRNWNGQMRQPIPLVTERAVVGTAPLEGFLHERSELDTLGKDLPDSECMQFGATQ
ncbi:ABC transporter substrate-binding protein [Paracoccus methylarcula]|uniref:Branched-chain amino acid ABC transporter substrate-binding protein n=1 Tax=Paracoccus methylarcula TaxID=72022 RepID=A0A3R7NW49_9RHOB|nr:ABC transporter substrate-binding protein [Paracoccus methylarcula]RNF33288.1 branched-chain amino acid ABC transporter substrate-binding protein [Paracoccus methylarcula]